MGSELPPRGSIFADPRPHGPKPHAQQRAACRTALRQRAARLRPCRTALFSLGNLAAHPRCGDALHALGLPTQLAELQPIDSTLLKYANRVAQKLDDARATETSAVGS